MLKLYYFDAAARGEVSRMMLRMSGTEFEDIRFPMSRGEGGEWLTKYKPMSPTGQCPFLEVEGGNIIAQTAAVETYIGLITGFLPKEPLPMALAVMFCQTWAEMWETLGPTWMINDPAEKLAARAKLMADDGATHRMLAALERMVAQRTTAFSMSDELTVADLNAYQSFKAFECGC